MQSLRLADWPVLAKARLAPAISLLAGLMILAVALRGLNVGINSADRLVEASNAVHDVPELDAGARAINHDPYHLLTLQAT